MTIFEKIKSKDIDEFVDWIDEYFNFDSAPYWKWWDGNYCSKCKAVIQTNDEGRESEYAYCEVHGNCQFFKDACDIPNNKQTIKMWLESEC